LACRDSICLNRHWKDDIVFNETTQNKGRERLLIVRARGTTVLQSNTTPHVVVPTPSIRGTDIEGIGALNLATEIRLKSDEGKQQRPILLDLEGQFCLASSSGP